MTYLGINHVMISAYHPQCNGVLERFHSRLKDAIRVRAGAFELDAAFAFDSARLATSSQ
jgi:transposase InsO family protein